MIYTPQEGPLVLEPGPVFAKDGDKNRSELISYRILRGLNRTWTEPEPEYKQNQSIKAAVILNKLDKVPSNFWNSGNVLNILNLSVAPPAWCADDGVFLPSGNEGNIFQIDEETGNITMTKAADIVGPITLTVLVNDLLSLVVLSGVWMGIRLV